MRFLVDEDVAIEVARSLRQAGHDVSLVAEALGVRTDDVEIWRHAVRTAAIVHQFHLAGWGGSPLDHNRSDERANFPAKGEQAHGTQGEIEQGRTRVWRRWSNDDAVADKEVVSTRQGTVYAMRNQGVRPAVNQRARDP